MNLPASSAPDEAAPAGGATKASVVLLLFAAARVAAGTARDEMSAQTVGDVLALARCRYGSPFTAVLDASRVWVNGEPSPLDRMLCDGDEVAVLPPVSGGACEPAMAVT